MLRAGVADKFFSGIIRDDGTPVLTCPHNHIDRKSARACAKAILAVLRTQIAESKKGA